MALSLFAACALAAGSNAQAQQTISSMSAPPTEKILTSEGGVDMRTGRFIYDSTDLSIGGGGDTAGLSLSRATSSYLRGHADAFAGFANNWEIMLVEKRIGVQQGFYIHGQGQDYRISIKFGGRSQTFQSLQSQGAFTHISGGPHAKLTYTGNRSSGTTEYSFQAADGTLVSFRPIGGGDCSTYFRCAYASQILYPDGTAITLSYDAAAGGNPAKLRRVVSSRGYALLFELGASGASTGHVTKACVLNLATAPLPGTNSCPTNAGATATYAYTYFGSGSRLQSVTGPDSSTASFTYTTVSNGTEMGFLKAGQSTPWLVNTIWPLANDEEWWTDAVMYQIFADGRNFGYSYYFTPQVDAQASSIAGGEMSSNTGTTVLEYSFPINPNSVPTGQPINFGDPVDYQVSRGPTMIRDRLNRVTTADYCDRYIAANLPANYQYRCVITEVQSVTDPEGIKTEYSYDGWRNVTEVRRKAKSGSGLPDIVVSAGYDCLYPASCTKPVWSTDARGNTTNFTYDPVHGGILAETKPADSNGVRPITRYAYVQRRAWVSNGSGGYVQAATPVWLLSTEKTCRTTATVSGACAGGAADEVVTAYDYGPDSGPNTLLLRGKVVTADGVSLRTCYGYDAMGNKISETSPRAGLTVCP